MNPVLGRAALGDRRHGRPAPEHGHRDRGQWRAFLDPLDGDDHEGESVSVAARISAGNGERPRIGRTGAQ